jgi:hemolysin activation/secretion protein
MSAAAGHELDADHELTIGGDTGLRGYPLRYQAGSGTAILTIEQRYFTDISLWQLADVGAAVFFDMGRAWGDPLLGPSENHGLLKDVGIGLRLGSSRSALGNVLHIDVAFPLDSSRDIDDVQFLVQTKRSF